MDARTPDDVDSKLKALLAVGAHGEAATLLVTAYGDDVYGLCRAMVRDPASAEDLSQDCFSRAFTALEGFRAEASARTWLLRIARNRCIDHLRARARAMVEFSDDPGDMPSEEPSIADLLTRREALAGALEVLGANERALVVLRFGHELEYGDLALSFGLGEGAVRMRISRAVAKMRAALEREESRVGSPAPSRTLAGGISPAPAALAELARRPRASSDSGSLHDVAGSPPAGSGGAPSSDHTRRSGPTRRGWSWPFRWPRRSSAAPKNESPIESPNESPNEASPPAVVRPIVAHPLRARLPAHVRTRLLTEIA